MVADNPNELRLTDDENVLSMVDHHVTTRDGIRFNTQQGRQWINKACQTNIEEMEAELRTVAMRATRSGPLTMVWTHVPQDRLRVRENGDCPAPRGQCLEGRRLGTKNDQQQTTLTPHTTTNLGILSLASQGGSQADTATIINTEKISVLM